MNSYLARYTSDKAHLTVEEIFSVKDSADAIKKAINFIADLNATCANDFCLKAVTFSYSVK